MGVRKSTGANSTSKSTTTIDSSQIFSARVRYCILDDKTDPEAFNSNGGWSSIGGIFFENVKYPNPSQEINNGRFAKPLFPNIKNFPLKNEVVYVIQLSSTGIETNTNDKSYYYFQPINIWNSTHHNAIPDGINNSTLPPSQKRDYQQTEAGSVRRVTDSGTDIDLGSTFKEKLTIKPLQPFEGDIIYEGRWGQSIRFGSTVNNSKIDNTWSKVGENGNPLTILRNGQHINNEDPWIPQVEDINKDLSSIYLTSTQEIPITPSSTKYNSYESPPILPNKFTGEQVIINSGRLLFNSKNDSILMSSKDTINLNSINSINIDSPKTIIQSTEILLGNKNATEPMILGDKFLEDLNKLLIEISSLGNILGAMSIVTVPFTPVLNHSAASIAMASRAQSMISKINTYKSKVTKSK